MIARIYKVDRAGTVNVLKKLSILLFSSTRQAHNPRSATYSYLWKVLDLLAGIDMKESTGVFSSLPLLISGRSNLVKSHHWSR